jgi:hypothetical protein
MDCGLSNDDAAHRGAAGLLPTDSPSLLRPMSTGIVGSSLERETKERLIVTFADRCDGAGTFLPSGLVLDHNDVSDARIGHRRTWNEHALSVGANGR